MFSNIKNIFKSWLDHDPFTQSAAAAYYAIFSLPGLLIIFMGISAFFLEQKEIEEKITAHFNTIFNENTTASIYQIVDNMQLEDNSLLAVGVGLLTLFLGATGLFVQLQRSLNNIWDVEERKSSGLWRFMLDRMLSLGVIITVGFLFLISLLTTALVTFVIEWFSSHFSPALIQTITITNFLLSFMTITLLFSIIFKVLPDVKVAWKHALEGGVISAAIFIMGEYALKYYFETAQPQTSFGAAGSIILIMIWVFYSCMSLLVGAESTKFFQTRVNKKIEPKDSAK